MPIRHHASIPSLVISAHVPSFTQFMNVKAGETVTVGKEDTEFPGWLWCTDSRGISNWVPKSILKFSDNPTRAEFLEDYDATELNVKVGDIVTVYGEQNGWVWIQTIDNRKGWIPKSCLGGIG